jgi:hypothetical protein
MKNLAEQARAFAAQLLALAAALPADADVQRVGAALCKIAAEADSFMILAACGDFRSDHPLLVDRLLGEAEQKTSSGEARAVLLLHCEDGSLLALGPQGSVYRENPSSGIVQHDNGIQSPLCQALSHLILDPENNNNSILAYSKGHGTAQDGASESVAGFLNRSDAILWIFREIAANGIERPVELQVFIEPEDGVLWGSSLSATRLLREVPKQTLLNDRLAQMSEAVEQLCWSDTVRNQLLLHAVASCERWWSMLAEFFAGKAEAMHGDTEKLPRQLAELRAHRKKCQIELQRWEGRWADPAKWLTVSEAQDDLPSELQEQLSKLRAEDIALAKELLHRQREEIRCREEQRYVEHRREEAVRNLEDLKQETGRSVEECQNFEREARLAQLAWEQWRAEQQLLTQQAASLIRREADQAEKVKEFPHLVFRTVKKGALASDKQIAELRAVSRLQRWPVQASVDGLAAIVAVSAAAEALEHTIAELGGDAGTEASIMALRSCRKSCESLARLQTTAGLDERLRLQRRVLARQVRAAAAQVRNYSEVLKALDAAATRVPLTELWRELRLQTQPENALVHFAEGIAGWLCHGDGAAARAGRALAAIQPSAEALSEVLAFVEQQGGERQEEFFAAVLEGDLAMKRIVLRSAPRSSDAYRRALLEIGYELMTTIETGSAIYE